MLDCSEAEGLEDSEFGVISEDEVREEPGVWDFILNVALRVRNREGTRFDL